MQYIADLHIHSKYSRACSPQLTLENISKYCAIKGVDVVATGDFTHPIWFKEIETKLVEDGSGIYKLRNADDKTRFVLSTEISCIYSKSVPGQKEGSKKVRRLHIVVLAPDIDTVRKINETLGKIGNLRSDGRPILGLDAKRLAQIVFDISPRCMVIPAHAWTPWFAVFGSKSGFDSLQECFEEYTDKIYAIETGLSSDPPMNWRLSALDNVALISNSDAHSLPNIGREANVFDLPELTYDQICDAIKDKDKKRFLYTIEFYPEEGMYHFDGHRDCAVCLPPSETRKQKGVCPKCKKYLTVGVLSRIEELADRPEGFMPPEAIPYKSLVELDKIIAESLNIKSRQSKGVQSEYDNLVKKGKNEMNVLLNLDYKELEKITSSKIVEGIRRVREGKLIIRPGFDGQYGKIEIFSPAEREESFQKKLL
ncbi:MAG: endonuclease Q family protein [Patescibacteria group bacterium]|jgi:PHP family Zn ribbon phosphoesterase